LQRGTCAVASQFDCTLTHQCFFRVLRVGSNQRRSDLA
jgi:hypothetical protein